MSSPASPEMSQLRNARAGDLLALRQLVRQHQAQAFGLALHLTGGHAQAMELAHDAFLQLHAALPRIASPAHLQHWLAREIKQRASEQGWLQPQDSVITATDPGEQFTARVMAGVELRWSHRRADCAPARQARRPPRRGRTLLIVAAAAMLGLAALLALWWPVSTQQPATAGTQADATRAGDAPQAAAQVAASDAERPAATASTAATPVQDIDARHTVIVLPARHASRDASAIAPVEAFHAALVAQLGRDPDLVLLLPGATAPPETRHPADFLLILASLETQATAAGGTAIIMTDGRSGALSPGTAGPGRWPVEIRIQPLRDSNAAGYVSTLQISDDQAALPLLAARQAEQLRAQMFPDTVLQQQRLARFRDTTLTAPERQRALESLLGARSSRGVAFTAVDMSILVAGAATLPASSRAQLWRGLRGNVHPELVDALLEALRDPDQQARFEALATLAADYRNEPQVRAAIESVSRQDADPALRMAARRALLGESEWRSQIIHNLRDTTLPAAERIAPLLLAGHSATTPAEVLAMQGLLRDEEILDLLATLVRDNWFDYTQADAIGEALALQAGQGIAAPRGLLVEIPQDGTRVAAMPAAPAPPPAQLSPAAMAWLQDNRNNALARRTLEDIARGTASAQQLATIERMARLPQRPPPRGQRN